MIKQTYWLLLPLLVVAIVIFLGVNIENRVFCTQGKHSLKSHIPSSKTGKIYHEKLYAYIGKLFKWIL